MFENLGGWELAFVAVLVLVVVGPERLPVLARDAARWIGRLRELAGDSVAQLRAAADIDEVAGEVSTLRRELAATRDELRRSLSEPSRTVQDVVKGVDPGGPTDRRPAPVDPDAPPPFDEDAT